MRGRRIAVTSRLTVGGYQAQAAVALAEGLDLARDARVEELPGSVEDLVRTLLEDRTDAVFLRSGVLETLIQRGVVEPGALRVLGAREAPGYPFALSTPLYPGLAMFALPQVGRAEATRLAGMALSGAFPHRGILLSSQATFELPYD